LESLSLYEETFQSVHGRDFTLDMDKNDFYKIYIRNFEKCR